MIESDKAKAVEAYCSHTCAERPNLKINPSHCEKRRAMAGKATSALDTYPGQECLNCKSGPIPIIKEQEEPKVEAATAISTKPPRARSERRPKQVPKCRKCGRTESDGATFYPSTLTQCRDCHYANRMARQRSGRELAHQNQPSHERLPEPPVKESLTTAPHAGPVPAMTCIHCGNPVGRDKIGGQWLKNVCKPCYLSRKHKALVSKHNFSKSENVVRLVFEEEDKELLAQIRAMSKSERRPIDQQIIYLVEKGLGEWSSSSFTPE